MSKLLTVVPERCCGCRTCELICSIHRFGVNNPKKSSIRVTVLYPHPVIRMPIVCHQCKEPKCRENCPVNAIERVDGVVRIDEEVCISCQQCIISCPFGAMFMHDDLPTPFNCNLCGGEPQCVEQCPKDAIQFVPEQMLGQAHRMASVLKYTHMREVEYVEKGEPKKLKYADIEAGRGSEGRGQ